MTDIAYWESPEWRAVAEDAAIERGEWPVWRAAFDRFVGICCATTATATADAAADAAAFGDGFAFAYADAFADADAFAEGFADAFADAYADGDGDAFDDAYADGDDASQIATGGEHLKPGLYLFQTPSGSARAVLRVGWICRAPDGGDEYEVHGCRTPLRSDYAVTLDKAEMAPPPQWRWTDATKNPRRYTRHQIQDARPLDVDGYAELCPAPEWAR